MTDKITVTFVGVNGDEILTDSRLHLPRVGEYVRLPVLPPPNFRNFEVIKIVWRSWDHMEAHIK